MIKKTLKALSILCILILSNFASHANEMSQEKIEKIIENFIIQNPKLLTNDWIEFFDGLNEDSKNILQNLLLLAIA